MSSHVPPPSEPAPAPRPAESNEMAYAVHTSTCTYLLDEDGVCRWIVSQQGVVPSHVRQCIGAQFVACLDVSVDGALVAELRIGGRALFVQHTGERMVMLRTGPIAHVDDRRRPQSLHDDAPPPPAAAVRMSGRGQYGKPAVADPRHVALAPPNPPPMRAPSPTPSSSVSFGKVEYHGEEQTITINRSRDQLPAMAAMWGAFDAAPAPQTPLAEPPMPPPPEPPPPKPALGSPPATSEDPRGAMEFAEYDLPTRPRKG